MKLQNSVKNFYPNLLNKIDSIKKQIHRTKKIKTPYWSSLKKVGSNKLVQSMHIWIILVPVVAKTMSLFEGPLVINLAQQEYEFDISLPFAWVLFFFAALAFTIANLIYLSCAPKIIKDHDDFRDFELAGKAAGHFGMYFSANFIEFWNNTKESASPNSDNDLKSLFWQGYYGQDFSCPITRSICFAFYTLGFILISIVLLQNIWWVMQQVNF